MAFVLETELSAPAAAVTAHKPYYRETWCK